jgi:hypothetical protein
MATAFCLAGDQFGELHDLQIFDFGEGGVEVFSPHFIQPGTAVSLSFQKSNFTARRGVSVACTPCGEGYRVDFRFEGLLAA